MAKRHGVEIIDQIVYFDSSHIMAGYAKSLVPFLQPTFKKVLAG